MYLVIFCYWVGPVPYLELFGVGPVEKNTLYYSLSLKIFPVLDHCRHTTVLFLAVSDKGRVKKIGTHTDTYTHTQTQTHKTSTFIFLQFQFQFINSVL